MRVVILGTGALGCVFAERLASQVEVWVLGTWVEGVAAIQRDGLRIHEPDGSLRRADVRAVTDPAHVPPADIALLLVKSYQTARAAAWAAQVLAPHGLAVTLQNGLDNAPQLSAAVGAARAVIGVTYVGATLLGPGEARLAALQLTYLGQHSEASVYLPQFVVRLRAAGFEAEVTEEIAGRLWAKAIANAAINPLTALWHVPNGALLATADRRRLLATLAEEATAVARARGVTLPFDDSSGYVEAICRATARNRSSMLQDLERGRPTEIDSINGVIVVEGRRLGVPTPANETVWRLVRGQRPLERVKKQVPELARSETGQSAKLFFDRTLGSRRP